MAEIFDSLFQASSLKKRKGSDGSSAVPEVFRKPEETPGSRPEGKKDSRAFRVNTEKTKELNGETYYNLKRRDLDTGKYVDTDLYIPKSKIGTKGSSEHYRDGKSIDYENEQAAKSQQRNFNYDQPNQETQKDHWSKPSEEALYRQQLLESSRIEQNDKRRLNEAIRREEELKMKNKFSMGGVRALLG